ncbi:hypothetical protein AAHE18_04G046300 [Arachis hypogaea]
MALRWLVHSACHILGYYTIDKTFQMPLHYPHYTKGDYKIMEEWKVDLLLQQYGLSFKGTFHDKRTFYKKIYLFVIKRFE